MGEQICSECIEMHLGVMWSPADSLPFALCGVNPRRRAGVPENRLGLGLKKLLRLPFDALPVM